MRNAYVSAVTTAVLLASIVAAQATTTSHSTHDHGTTTTSHSTHDHSDYEDEETTTSHSTHDHASSQTASSHEGHDHEGGHFEAAAVYDVEAGSNFFIAYPESLGEESLAFMIVRAASADEEGLESAEEDAEAGKSIKPGIVPCSCCVGTRRARCAASSPRIVPELSCIYWIGCVACGQHAN